MMTKKDAQQNSMDNREPYIPAKMIFEGGGIRRGLTPPEAAILLGRPFDHCLALVILGMLEKGFIYCTSINPLVFRVSKEMETRGKSMNAGERGRLRRQGAQKLVKVIYPYEEPVLELLEQFEGQTIQDIDFSIIKKPIYDMVSARMNGYDMGQSQPYYQTMISRAKARMAELKDGNQVAQNRDKELLWITVEKDWSEILKRTGLDYTPEWRNECVENTEGGYYSFISKLIKAISS